MSPATCTRSSFDFAACVTCNGYGDCMWDAIKPPTQSESRTDAPYKIVLPCCSTHRAHDFNLKARRHHYRGPVMA